MKPIDLPTQRIHIQGENGRSTLATCVVLNGVALEKLDPQQCRQVADWMAAHVEEYRKTTGEIGRTQLAEAACAEFDLYDGTAAEIPADLFELSHAIAVAAEKE